MWALVPILLIGLVGFGGSSVLILGFRIRFQVPSKILHLRARGYHCKQFSMICIDLFS